MSVSELIPYWLLPNAVLVAEVLMGARVLRAVEHNAMRSADEDLTPE